MESETKKFTVNRELKNRVPANVLKKITTACSGYGNGQIISEASGISYNTIAAVIKTKLATPKVLESILAGIKEVNQTKRVKQAA